MIICYRKILIKKKEKIAILGLDFLQKLRKIKQNIQEKSNIKIKIFSKKIFKKSIDFFGKSGIINTERNRKEEIKMKFLVGHRYCGFTKVIEGETIYDAYKKNNLNLDLWICIEAL